MRSLLIKSGAYRDTEPKMPMTTKITLARTARGLARTLLVLCAFSGVAHANAFTKIFSDDEPKYVTAPPAPKSQSDEDVRNKSDGCQTCHTTTDSKSMHMAPAVKLGCTDCHGGDANVRLIEGVERGSGDYLKAQEKAHVLPRFPDEWNYPSSANPRRTYTLLNKE